MRSIMLASLVFFSLSIGTVAVLSRRQSQRVSSHAPVPVPCKPIRVLCITLGGPRREKILKMFFVFFAVSSVRVALGSLIRMVNSL